MSEKPLERLNYFNGQRLQAGDFKLEQDYHMRVRRWLNRSLYTAGIAMGLEIYPVAGAPKVRVNPGLAIDPLGREIILLDAREIPVMHDIGQGAQLAGSYVVIRYSEELIAQQDANCSPASNCGDKAATGGPSRVLADPVIECVPDLPQEASGKILLGRVVLAPGCGSVAYVDTSTRRYVGAESVSAVRQYALEGEREVAAVPSLTAGNPIRVKTRLIFHIRGRQPTSITLFLKTAEFSALHYTEIGAHTHSVSVTGSTQESDPVLDTTRTAHPHASGTLAATGITNQQPFDLTARKGYIGSGQNQNRAGFLLIERNQPAAGIINVPVNPESILDDVNGTISGGDHEHTITGSTESSGPDLRHTHPISGSGASGPVAQDPNAVDPLARIGPPLTQLRDLQIAVDGVDRTAEIRAQIQRTVPANQTSDWALLGDGTATHPIANADEPAVPIRLDYLTNFTAIEGEHSIEFSVGLAPGDAANGGRLHYNLYIE